MFIRSLIGTSFVVLISLFYSSSLFATEVLIFEKTFERSKGKSESILDTFLGFVGPGKLILVNGGGKNNVSSAQISINGKKIFSRNNFNKKVEYLESDLSLAEQNSIEVIVNGKPESNFTLSIVQEVVAEPTNEEQILYDLGGEAGPLPVTIKSYLGKIELPGNYSVDFSKLSTDTGIVGYSPIYFDGHFRVVMNADATTMITVGDASQDYLMKLFPKSENIREITPVVDTKSTAVSLIALQAGLVTGEPNIDALLLALLDRMNETKLLADQIEVDLMANNFNLGGNLSSAAYIKLFNALVALNNITAPDVLAYTPTDYLKHYFSRYLSNVGPRFAHAAGLIDNNCWDSTSNLLYDTDEVDRDGICLTGNINGSGEQSELFMENKMGRWVLLALEESPSDLDWIDWVSPRKIIIPKVGDLVSDLTSLVWAGGKQMFYSVFKGEESNFLQEGFKEILEEYFGNRKSQKAFTFPDDTTYDLLTLGSNKDMFNGPYVVEKGTSLVMGATTELLIPWVAVVIEIRTNDVVEAIGTSISNQLCTDRLIPYLDNALPIINNVIINSASAEFGETIKDFATEFVVDSLLQKESAYLMGCLLKNVFDWQTVKYKIMAKVTKFVGSAGPGAILQMWDQGASLVTAGASTTLFLNSFFDGDISSVDGYTVDLRDHQESIQGWNFNHGDLAGTNYYPYSSNVLTNTTLQEEFSFTGNGSVLTGDIDGDGLLETVFTSGNVLTFFDVNHNQQVQVTMPSDGYITMIDDVDGDGIKDVGIRGANGSGRIYFYNGQGTLINTITRSVGYDGSIWPIAVTNSGDIAVRGSAGYSRNPRGIYLYDYTTGQQIWGYDVAPFAQPGITSIADIDHDGEFEYVLDGGTPHNGAVANGTTDGDFYLVMMDDDGSNLVTQKYPAPSNGSVAHIFTDMNRDGNKEVVGIERHDPRYYRGINQVHLYDLFGNTLYSYNGPSNENWMWAIADTDNDGYDNVIVGGYTVLTILNQNLQELLSVQDDGFVYSACDLTGDGFVEIITVNNSGLLRAYDYQLNLLSSFQLNGTPSTWKGLPASDWDNDGIIELLVPTNTSLQVLSFSN